MRRILMLLLISLTLTLSLSGCKKEKAEEKESKVLDATDVIYNTLGEYETVIKDKRLKGVSKGNVKIVYTEPTKVSNSVRLGTKEATVKTVINNGEELKIAFNGKSEIGFPINVYTVIFNGLNMEADVLVKDLEIKLNHQEEVITTDSENLLLKMELSGSEFNGEIKASDLILGGSFKDMKISEVSNSKTNLTVGLTGKLHENEKAQTYVEGSLKVNPKAIKNARNFAVSKYPISIKTLEFDPSSLTYQDGKVEVSLIASGRKDLDSLTLNDLTFEKNVDVTKLEKADNKLNLTLAIKDVKNANEAANYLNNSKVTLKGENFTCRLEEASFYPVFDYVEADGDNFNITLNLFAKLGSFKKDIKNEDIILGADFEGGRVNSVKRVNDYTLELNLTCNNKGQTEDNINLNGLVKVKNGVLINEWGNEKAEVGYFRNYSPQSLGKGLHDHFTDNFLKVFKILQSDRLAAVLKYVGGIGEGAMLIYELLSICGVIPNQDQITQQMIRDLHDAMMKEFSYQKNYIEENTKQIIGNRLDTFNRDLDSLSTYTSIIYDLYDDAARALGVSKPGENTTQEETLAYLLKIKDKVQSYPEYREALSYLRNYYINVTNALTNGDRNPLALYNQLCTYIFNFNTSSVPSKYKYATDIMMVMLKAYAVLEMNNEMNGGEHSLSTEGKALQDASEVILNYVKDVDKLNYFEIIKKDKFDERIYMYVLEDDVDSSLKAIRKYPSQAYTIYFDMTGVYMLTDLFGSPDSLYPVDMNLFDDQAVLDSFLKRMQGRTMREEFELAGIKTRDINGNSFGTYFALKNIEVKVKRKKYDTYCMNINLDTNEITTLLGRPDSALDNEPGFTCLFMSDPYLRYN